MTCRICGNSAGNTTHTVREMMFGTRETFTYFQCANCGCLQIAEIPPDMSRYYPPEYLSFRPLRRRTFTRRLRSLLGRQRYRYAVLNTGTLGRLLYRIWPKEDLRLLSWARLTEDSRILDVGCGTGGLLYRLHAIGLRNLLGIDPFIERNITYPNGLKVLKRSFDEVDGTWDLVMFNHSLEHMPDQTQALSKAARLLSPDGTCLVRMPTVSSYGWEHYGVNWFALEAPRHLYLHSNESIALLAGKTGFRVDRTIYDSSAFHLWASEQYVHDIPLRSERSYEVDRSRAIFTPEDIEAFDRQADELNRENRGDTACFYLVKT